MSWHSEPRVKSWLSPSSCCSTGVFEEEPGADWEAYRTPYASKENIKGLFSVWILSPLMPAPVA